MNLGEIKELGLNQVFKKKKKNFNQQTKASMHVIKDNSIGLLEFEFDLNFDEILKKKLFDEIYSKCGSLEINNIFS